MGKDQHPQLQSRALSRPEHGPKEEYYGFVSEAQALSWIQKEMHLRPNAKGADPKATWRKKPGEDD